MTLLGSSGGVIWKTNSPSITQIAHTPFDLICRTRPAGSLQDQVTVRGKLGLVHDTYCTGKEGQQVLESSI